MGINWGKRAEENVVDYIEQMQAGFHILGCSLTKLVLFSEMIVRGKKLITLKYENISSLGLKYFYYFFRL